MRRFATLIALAACDGKSISNVSTVDPAPQIAAPVTARHGAMIELVAATDDGSAAVTQDTLGGSRLWPTLDGTREPVVVQLPFATSLVIGRTPNGYVIATLDESRGGQIVDLDRAGRVRTRTDLAPDPAITQLAIDQGHVIAVRADHTLSIIAANGELLAHLAAPEGRRITRVATHHRRALVLFDRDAAWLAGTRWGEPVAVAFHEGAEIHGAALSPDTTKLALHIGDMIVVYSLLTGDSIQDIAGGSILDLAFTDDETLGIHREGSIEWRPIDGGELRMEAKSIANPEGSAWANGVLIRGAGRSLELRTLERTRYLGYAYESMPLVGVDETRIPPDPRPLVDVQRIDATHVLATHRNTSGWNSLSVIDTATKTAGQALTTPVEISEQRYEPSTQLLAVSDQTASYLVRYDSAKAAFLTWYRIEYEPSDLYVLDPARASGVVAIAVHPDDDHALIRAVRFRADELVVGLALEAHDTYWYTGRFLGLDAHGYVYVARAGDLVAHDGNTEVRHIRGAITQKTGRVLDTSAGLVLLDGDTLALFGPDGAERWRVSTSARDIMLRGDSVFGFFIGGVGRFDLATGALVERTCGGGFGFIDAPQAPGPDEETICEAP